ncbi:endopeptidase La, partial [Verrucomicrobia bacterium]|nr:endopeptidase La [Verrucomicrobiota bacterium]
LCLVGPPGVGKTSMGRSIAEALGRPFARISLGGVRDEGEIRGHRRTYVGSMPGRILQTLKRLKVKNPVILLDEIDKLGSDFRGDPASALLEVLDPQQNKHFSDHYLELPFDLSEILFITTANWLDPVHPALRDRLEVIELPSYTTAEKIKITRRHLLPRLLKDHGLKTRQIKLPSASIRMLVDLYTREAGVRQLERTIASTLRKAAREQLESPDRQGKITISEAWIQTQLGQPKHPAPDHETIEDSGIAVGLGWTPSGGEILFVEATSLPGKGKLILTGSLGEVMKESAQAALTHLRSQAKSMGLALPSIENLDIHIHVPAGATPKDGPSAGIAIFAALASLFTQTLISSRMAMTGEISLRGRVLPVGGIKEKLLAAARSGIKEIILPEANKKDWIEAPAEVQKKLKIHWVRHVEEMLPVMFGNNAKRN